jgi:hypothetical protein
MFTVSVSVEVNPAGAAPALSREQLWRGLEIKAEDPVPFVPGMESSRVAERVEHGFIREVTVRGHTFQERILFTPAVQIRFDRIEGRESGWIANTLSEGPTGLLLTYTIAIGFPGVWPGSDEEKLLGEELRANYSAAIDQTLGLLRKLAAEGKL